MFQGPAVSWWGIGARVRVILWNKNKLNKGSAPKSIGAFVRPEWLGRCVMADPSKNGSSRYHIWTLFACLTPSEGRRILDEMKSNRVQFVDSDAAVVDAVANGKAEWGMTDSDVAYRAVEDGKPVDYAITDQELYSTQDALGKPHMSMPQIGTPLLPLALALIHNRPHVRDTYDLAAYFYTPGAAADVAQSDPALIATNMDVIQGLPNAKGKHIINPDNLKIPPVTFASITEASPEANKAIAEVFEGE
jgi:ABC-type Fe3+ transport system substrate-binding protein